MLRILIPALLGFILGAVLFKDMADRGSTMVVTAQGPTRVITPAAVDSGYCPPSLHTAVGRDLTGIGHLSETTVYQPLATSEIYWAKKNYANSESTKREFRQFMKTYARGGMIQPDRVSDDDKARAKAMSGNGYQLMARTISRPESLAVILSSQARILGWYDPNGILHFVSGISHEESLFVKKQAREMGVRVKP